MLEKNMPRRQTTFRTLTVVAFVALSIVTPAWSTCPPGLPTEPVFHSPVEKLASVAERLADLIGSKAIQNRAIAGVETRQLSEIKLDPKLRYNFRVYTPLSEIPTHVQNALIASGDIPSRTDVESVKRRQTECIETDILKLLYENLRSKGRPKEFVPRAAVRIVHALAQEILELSEYEALFGQSIKTPANKAIVAYLTIKSEKVTADQIAELPVNLFYFGIGSFGITAASMNYFGKPVYELSLAQAAYLAGLLRAPNNYHPIRRADKAKERRNEVLGRMLEMQFISEADSKSARTEPLNVMLK